MNTTVKERGEADRPADRRQGRRLDEIAWALVLIMTGALWLAPKAMFPEGTWLAGLGLILLGLSAARRIRGVDASGFGIAVGVVALAAGASRMAGLDLPLVPVLMIVLGITLVLRAAISSGKSEGVPRAL